MVHVLELSVLKNCLSKIVMYVCFVEEFKHVLLFSLFFSVVLHKKKFPSMKAFVFLFVLEI